MPTSEITLLFLTLFVGSLAVEVYPNDAYGSVGQRRCFRPTRIEIPECKNRFYNFTAFPNLVGQDSQLDARHQLQTFKPLITYKCSNHLAFFLCSVYAPMCDVNTKHLIGPCRPLCERVRRRCSPVLKIFNFDWPANLNCSRFPEKNTVGGTMCMEGPDIPEDYDEEEAPRHPDSAEFIPEVIQPQTPPPLPPMKNDQMDLETEGIIRELDELPNNAGETEIAKLGPHLQTWISRLHQNPLPMILGGDDVPVGLLISSIRHCSHLTKPTFYVFINRTGRCAPHCMADILFSPGAKTLAAVWTSVISGLCLLATTYTLLSYAIYPALFHPLERPVIYIAGCQLAYGLGFALRLKLGRDAVTCGKDPASGYAIRLQEGLDNSNCAIVFLIQYYFFTAGALWWAMLVTGWASRSAHHLRMALATGTNYQSNTASSDTYSLVKDTCCCCWLGVKGGGEEKQLHRGTASSSSTWRLSQFNRRGNIGTSADTNCLAKEHVVAWLAPGLLTVGVLVSRQVDADELLGICSVGRQNTKAMLIFVLIPQVICLIIGIVAFVFCVIYLFKLRSALGRHHHHHNRLGPSDSQSRYLSATYQSDQQSDLETTLDGGGGGQTAGSLNSCCRSLRWDSLSTRLGFFSLLYVVPAIAVLVCDFYEYLYRDSWLAGDPLSAVSRILKGPSHGSAATDGEATTTTPEVFLLRTFMSLVTGFATCLWLLSIKGIESWRRLARKIGSRGCFSTQTKTLPQQLAMASMGSGNPTHPPLPSTPGQYSKTNPSNASTVLHPYAVYQHYCSSAGKTSGRSGGTDERFNHHLAIRPPAGPGMESFLQQLPSPNQASGYYSSATTNNSVGSGSCVPPGPPPNTPPGTILGDSNTGSSSAAGGWWEPMSGRQQPQTSTSGGQKRHSSSSGGAGGPRHPVV